MFCCAYDHPLIVTLLVTGSLPRWKMRTCVFGNGTRCWKRCTVPRSTASDSRCQRPPRRRLPVRSAQTVLSSNHLLHNSSQPGRHNSCSCKFRVAGRGNSSSTMYVLSKMSRVTPLKLFMRRHSACSNCLHWGRVWANMLYTIPMALKHRAVVTCCIGRRSLGRAHGGSWALRGSACCGRTSVSHDLRLVL